MRKSPVYLVIIALIVALLGNSFGISFKREVFTHELDHIRQALSPNPELHLQAHQNNVPTDGKGLDEATHLCLHAAGQYQPFYFIHISIPCLPASNEKLTVYIPLVLPDSVPESPYHPPRKTV
ncbi:hypothetical protein [Nitrosomonas sp. Nm51]|uniref:hypothetical protein n=1 Tax=Nitrosomonas sp. Nm51 TaxID=133720 RepID=UPI000B855D26|nr:hypothetical protein [Nitrosomonas sp. Nm51]